MTIGDTATKQQGAWEFTQALALINNLRSSTPTPQDPLEEYQIPPADHTGNSSLGDFNRLWSYLQTEPPTQKDRGLLGPESTIAPKDELLDFQNLAYTSDGGIFASTFKRKSKPQVRWDDEVTDINDAVGDTGGDTAASITGDEASAIEGPLKSKDSITGALHSDLTPAGKKQSKKARQKQRKQEERAKAQEAAARQKAKSDVESEAELGTIARVTPARKASVHSNKMLTPTKDDQSNIKKTRKPRLPYTVSMPETQQNPSNASGERRKSNTAEEQQTPAPTLPPSERRAKIIMPLNLPTTLVVKENNVPTGPKLAAPTPSKPKRRTSNTADTPAAPPQAPQPTIRPPTGPRKNSQPAPVTPATKSVVTSTPNAAAASFIPNSTPAKKPVLAAYLQHQAPMRPVSAVNRPPQPVTIASPVPDHTIPIIARSKVDRDIDLRLRLIQDFIEDKRTLASPIHMANHNQDEKGLHVFVDFSNIWIGFMDILWQIKQKYIHRKDIYIDRKNKNLSFESLVLLLERGRPVAKRVLAGSPPLMPAHEMAKRIGYNTLILDKVYKQKTLTERQIFFETRDAERKAERGSKRRSGSHGASSAGAQQPYTPTPSRTQQVNGSTIPPNGTGTSAQGPTDPLTAAANAVAAATAQLRNQGAPSFASTPNSNTPRQQNPTIPHPQSNNLIQQTPSYNPNNTLPTPSYNPNLPTRRPSSSHPPQPEEHLAPPKWVEQAVDEMLHLHMLESMVDFGTTPGTMVLATGDAALAEYSGGFKEQVERALKKGWKVELVAFSKSIAMAYRKRGFFECWEGRFRIIELDDYAEFLLDEGGAEHGVV